MEALDPQTTREVLERFYDFGDAIIRSVAIDFHPPKANHRATIVCSARDRDNDANWCNVTWYVNQLAECLVAEGRVTNIILSQGLQIGWFSNKVYLDFAPYTVEPDDEEDFRRSGFYVSGAIATYEVGPYEE
jgi:hypothetical protein